jgi:hypothetical protein
VGCVVESGEGPESGCCVVLNIALASKISMSATENSDDSDVPVGELLARGRRNLQRRQNRPDAATMRIPSGAVVAGDSPSAERQSIGDSRNKPIAVSVFPVMAWPLPMDQLKVGEHIVVPFFDKPYTPLPHGWERGTRAKNGSICYKVRTK